MLFRMKYINRWALMRNSREETLSEHCLEVALIAHCLATIRNKRFGGNADADRSPGRTGSGTAERRCTGSSADDSKNRILR